VLPTGDARYPAVVVGEKGAHVFAAGERSLRPLLLPVPPADVLAATVEAGRLLVGTSGYGLLYAPLDELLPPASVGAGTVAGAPQ
jgi:hypothetical protein